jgi:hypothetical protein
MKHLVLSTVALLLAVTGSAEAEKGDIHGTLDFTFLNSYIWRGFDVYGDSIAAYQPSIDLDLFGSGFHANVLVSIPSESGTNRKEARYTPYYSSSIWKGEIYATYYKAGWAYYDFFDNPRETCNMHEVFATFTWPEICPAGIVPNYTVVCSWPYTSNSPLARKSAGWLHIFGLDYDWPVPNILPATPQQKLHLSAAVVFNDSAWDFLSQGGDGTVDHDWSHAVFAVSTDFDLGSNVGITPGVYYQASMDDSVNPEDEMWFSLKASYKF